ncbi:MAG: putative toxin-antitoxin system toxin component, PIN family [Deltaproteobacteria bacterium]|nr:putative toxin-antitoxin system toxin component, PIN family [Deltaproteobacteria bacterium]
MRVFLDTNVLIAAFVSHGACKELFEHCITTHNIFISPFILKEFEEKLTQKLKFPPEVVRDAVGYLKSTLQLVSAGPLEVSLCRDPDDDAVLAGAGAVKADCIITGDEDLLVLESYIGIAIVKPKDFWQFEREGK